MKTLNIIIAVMCLVSYSLPSNAADCASDREKAALNSRALQSHLMVAALSCGKQNSYNSFMQKFKAELTSGNEELKSYFSRRYSKESASKFNQFTTGLANESSKRSLRIEAAEFCNNTEKLFDKIMGVKPKELNKIASAEEFTSLHGVKSCNMQVSENNRY